MPNKACAPGGGRMRYRAPAAPFARPPACEWEVADGAFYSQSAVVVKAPPHGEWLTGWWEIHPYGLDRGSVGPFSSSGVARRWWGLIVQRGMSSR